jgi:hypothetical protein
MGYNAGKGVISGRLREFKDNGVISGETVCRLSVRQAAYVYLGGR